MRTRHNPTLPISLRIFAIFVTALTLVCLFAEGASTLRHLGYPYDYPLLFKHPSFMDFEMYFDHFKTFHTLAFFQGPDIMMYPSPVVLSYRFFYFFQPFATPVFLIFILALASASAITAVRVMIGHGLPLAKAAPVVILSSILSYPLWFEFKQANMEIVVCLFIGLGLLAFWKKHSWTAASFFGVAAAMKFYPIIYLALLFSRKRYRECLFGCFVACAIIFISLWVVGPTIPDAWRGMQAGLSIFKIQYMLDLRRNEIGFDHSLFALIKKVFGRLGKFHLSAPLSMHLLSTLLSGYLALAALAGTALYFIHIRFLPIINQLLCLTVASITLPPVSYDYTLLHLYVPWVLLALVAIQAGKDNRTTPGLNFTMACLAVAVAPLSEFISGHERFGGQLRVLILIAIFVVALRFPFALKSQETVILPRHQGWGTPT